MQVVNHDKITKKKRYSMGAKTVLISDSNYTHDYIYKWIMYGTKILTTHMTMFINESCMELRF